MLSIDQNNREVKRARESGSVRSGLGGSTPGVPTGHPDSRALGVGVVGVSAEAEPRSLLGLDWSQSVDPLGSPGVRPQVLRGGPGAEPPVGVGSSRLVSTETSRRRWREFWETAYLPQPDLLPSWGASGWTSAAFVERERISACGATFDRSYHNVWPCTAAVAVPYRCGSKWCRTCFMRWSAKNGERLEGAVASMKYPSHLVLSIRNPSRGALDEGLRLISESFARLTKRKFWRRGVPAEPGRRSKWVGGKWLKKRKALGRSESVRGWLASRGLTVNGENGSWHVHLHLVIDCAWMDLDRLNQAWESVTRGAGTSVGVSITRVTDRPGIARELLKGTKGDQRNLLESTKNDAEGFGELVEAMRNRKQFWTSKNIKLQGKAERALVCRCPGCDAPFAREEWSFESRVRKEAIDLAVEHGSTALCWYRGFVYEDPETGDRHGGERWTLNQEENSTVGAI